MPAALLPYNFIKSGTAGGMAGPAPPAAAQQKADIHRVEYCMYSASEVISIRTSPAFVLCRPNSSTLPLIFHPALAAPGPAGLRARREGNGVAALNGDDFRPHGGLSFGATLGS